MSLVLTGPIFTKIITWIILRLLLPGQDLLSQPIHVALNSSKFKPYLIQFAGIKLAWDEICIGIESQIAHFSTFEILALACRHRICIALAWQLKSSSLISFRGCSKTSHTHFWWSPLGYMEIELAQMNAGAAQIKVVKVAATATVRRDYILQSRRPTTHSTHSPPPSTRPPAWCIKIRRGVAANKVDHYGRRRDL